MENNEKYKFITEYLIDGKKYGSEIYAQTWEEAERILEHKRYTEVVVGYDPTIVYVTELLD